MATSKRKTCDVQYPSRDPPWDTGVTTCFTIVLQRVILWCTMVGHLKWTILWDSHEGNPVGFPCQWHFAKSLIMYTHVFFRG